METKSQLIFLQVTSSPSTGPPVLHLSCSLLPAEIDDFHAYLLPAEIDDFHTYLLPAEIDDFHTYLVYSARLL